jgi:hypothetical protein
MRLSKLGYGLIHVISPIGGSEHPLCGIAQDSADSEHSDLLRWVSPRKRGPVSCTECSKVVLHCRGI